MLDRKKRGQSPAMSKAEKLMRDGTDIHTAAKKAGVQVQSIYRRPWYKEVRDLRVTQ